MRQTLAPLLIALVLSGCAQGGKLEVARRGDAALPAGRTFALMEGQASGEATSRVAAALAEAGLTPAPATEADYLVTVAYTDRPSRIGVYTPTADPAEQPAWLAQGQKPPRAWIRKGSTGLKVRIEDRATAAPLREVEVRGFYWRDPSRAPARLAQAATARLLQP